MRKAALLFSFFLCLCRAGAQPEKEFTHADTLRGSVTPERAWWDVCFYDLHVKIDPDTRSISGYNGITYQVLEPAREMQIDLMEPLEVDSMVQDGKSLAFRREGNVFFVATEAEQPEGAYKTITVYYHGKPRVARRPPWDGGFVWREDSLGNHWIATACQNIGASVWWPNKDIASDEPDSQRVSLTIPGDLAAVSNGRLRGKKEQDDGTITWEWFVQNPINNYNIAVNVGKYAHFSDTLQGEDGELSLDYWPLAYNLEKAREQFRQVKPMLRCFEHWFGPYPWYEDGYKLVETPHLGMEHQSAVAYGNSYGNGYRGRDLSHTGWGMKFDFIIIHESGHEWFGNNITYRDIADMWVHESFTNYSESLYVECRFGKEAGAEYVIGTRQNVLNDRPVTGHYGVHDEGSGDMYYKGGNMLHTIRQVIGDDERWRAILRGLNQTFRHQTVTGAQVQAYISRESGTDLSKVFEQYLTTTKIPVLEYKIKDGKLTHRWADVVEGFDMPVKVTLSENKYEFIHPTTRWQTTRLHLSDPADFKIDKNFYVIPRPAAGM